MTFMGLPIYTNDALTVPFEDWSRVRSPSRARRRLKRGHSQAIRHMRVPDPNVYQTAGSLHMHSATAAKLRAELCARA